MNELSPIIIALAGLVSAVYGVINGQFYSLFNLLSPLLQLRSVDFSKLKGDLIALSPTDRATLESQFDASLSIPDPKVLLKIVGAASALDGAVSLCEDIVTSAFAFYNRALDLIAKVKGIFGVSTPPAKLGVSLPPWLNLPAWLPSWLVPILFSVLTTVVLPALAVALPAEAPLIYDIIAFLKGGTASPRLKAAHAHYHANP